ncbi:MAG: hypothetical protein HY905_16245 [Deltaproteobacteria bacterium]|nr:hypothetical protein [Deltaproteobacteria bacterium]
MTAVLALTTTACVGGLHLAGDEDDVPREAEELATEGDATDPADGDDVADTDPPLEAEADDGDGICAPLDAGTTSGWGTCEDLQRLELEAPVVSDDGGDGRVSPGEGADIRVVLRETAGLDFMWYPGVTFLADDPRVTVGSDDWRYGMAACSAEEYHARLSVPADMPSGTMVTVTARAAMLPDECPDANILDIPITVR